MRVRNAVRDGTPGAALVLVCGTARFTAPGKPQNAAFSPTKADPSAALVLVARGIEPEKRFEYVLAAVSRTVRRLL